jgi:hypothetical protein
MPIIKFIRNFFTKLPVLFFLNGVFLTTIFYCRIEDEYEKNIINRISQKIITDNPLATTNTDTFFIKAMEMANYLQERRLEVFGTQKTEGIKATFFHSITDDLLTGEGACGSASAILARILKSYNYKVRLPQMKVAGQFGGHIVTEVKKDKDWIVLDALYKTYFKKPDGSLAGFKEVSGNWAYYQKQLPANYPTTYTYEDARYTNWDKVPFAGNLTKFFISIIYGKKYADEFSVRSYLLRNYHFLYFIALSIYIPIVTITLIQLTTRKK